MWPMKPAWCWHEQTSVSAWLFLELHECRELSELAGACVGSGRSCCVHLWSPGQMLLPFSFVSHGLQSCVKTGSSQSLDQELVDLEQCFSVWSSAPF